MNIVLENIDELNALLKVEIKADDYKNEVESILKNYRKQAQIPGFRAGKIPMGVIRKRFGISAKVEKINELTSQEIGKYLQDNDISYLGGPLPKTDATIDFENQDDFTFEYELGLSPAVEVNITKRNKLTYYSIQAEETQIDEYALNIAQRYGKMEFPDAVAAGDGIRGTFAQLDAEGNEVEGGINHTTTFFVDTVEDEAIKNELIDSGAKTRVVMDVKKAFSSDDAVKQNLGIDDTTLENLESFNFSFTIDTVNRMVPAEYNEELFQKLYPEEEIKTEDDFRAKLKTEAEEMYKKDSDKKFFNDAVDYILEKNKFDLPETFLKKWVAANQENPLSEEELNKEFEGSKNYLRWQIIESKLAKDNDIKVEKEEIEAEAKELIALQMAQYGQTNIEEEMINGIVQNVLSNQKEVENISRNVFNKKMTTLLLDKFKIEEKEVAVNEFIEMMNADAEK
jgi:trigger factor